jgi:hypothetical protein
VRKKQKPLPKDVQMFCELAELMEVDGHFIQEGGTYSGQTGRGEIWLTSVADKRRKLKLSVQISPMRRSK